MNGNGFQRPVEWTSAAGNQAQHPIRHVLTHRAEVERLGACGDFTTHRYPMTRRIAASVS